ncbi:MAG TPA: M81 family metallopeptidase [Polyangiaceae bacterium]|nr:M81 family metallopeptidase [Polyangiaceae bacterium]
MSRALPFFRKLGRGGRPLRIAYARIFHEANAYSPLSTTREDFERMLSLEGEALGRATTLRGSELAGYMAHAELTGFVQAARAAGDVTTIPLASRIAVSGGPITPECFEWLVSDLAERIRAAGPLDGIYLALHGSMEVRDLAEAPEAVLLRRVREALGPDAKIAVSCDLHANLSEGLLSPVDVLVAYRTNPHWDLAPTGFRAGSRLIRVLRGQIHPVHAWRKLPVVLGGGVTIDFLAPMRKVFRRMRKMESDPRVVSASLFMVHPYTSADDMGWAVHVSTDGDPELANELAEELADAAWAEREVELPELFSVADAIEQAVRSPWRRLGPVTLVDVDDIVGAGAPGGNTQIVAELVRNDRGLVSLVPVHDPAAVLATWDVPEGTRVKVVLRGTPGYGQPEVPLEAVVSAKQKSDFGRIVRLSAGKLHVAVSERPPLPIHPKFWRELGIDPRRADLIVQKNFFHYRIFYAAISFAHIPTVSHGATSFDRVRNRSYRVPMHPASKLTDWRPSDPVLRRPRGASAPKRAGLAASP